MDTWYIYIFSIMQKGTFCCLRILVKPSKMRIMGKSTIMFLTEELDTLIHPPQSEFFRDSLPPKQPETNFRFIRWEYIERGFQGVEKTVLLLFPLPIFKMNEGNTKTTWLHPWSLWGWDDGKAGAEGWLKAGHKGRADEEGSRRV